jgi:hypothetical protein
MIFLRVFKLPKILPHVDHLLIPTWQVLCSVLASPHQSRQWLRRHPHHTTPHRRTNCHTLENVFVTQHNNGGGDRRRLSYCWTHRRSPFPFCPASPAATKHVALLLRRPGREREITRVGRRSSSSVARDAAHGDRARRFTYSHMGTHRRGEYHPCSTSSSLSVFHTRNSQT